MLPHGHQFSRDVMNDPANLPCNHVFCHECIMESLKGEFPSPHFYAPLLTHSRRATVRKGCPLCKVCSGGSVVRFISCINCWVLRRPTSVDRSRRTMCWGTWWPAIRPWTSWSTAAQVRVERLAAALRPLLSSLLLGSCTKSRAMWEIAHHRPRLPYAPDTERLR
jgi:hypothetical protein